MSLFVDPKFWLSLSFLSFLILTIKFIWPFILSKIDSRLKEVFDSVDLAEKSLKESEKLLSDAEKLYKNAIKSSKNLLLDADKEAQSLIIRSQKLVEEEIDKKLIAVQNRIKQEEEKLIRDLKSKIITSAVEAIEKDSLKFKSEMEEDLIIDSIDNLSAKIH
ncbi:ATP synthase F0 subunit B [Rickettsiales bacterium]|nr:ATP synthase F0 subunit B [Rickettsiales bacterium]